MKVQQPSRLCLFFSITLLLCCLLAGCSSTPTPVSTIPQSTVPANTALTPTPTPFPTPTPSPIPRAAGLHVVGNQIETNASVPITYHGVNRSGTEYLCTRTNGGTFDGPSNQASIDAMLTWKINVVRVPLNEDCWLGINGQPADGTGAAQYRQDIISYVNLLRQNNLTIIIELHETAPGKTVPTKQQPMPDLDHTPAFWTSVANTFKSNPLVILDLFNEPFTKSWDCWLNGSTGPHVSPCTDVDYASVGMQALVNIVRKTGADNVILVAGLAFADDLSQWLQHKPTDPQNNLAASLHLYSVNACRTPACLDKEVAPVVAQYPVIAGEIGEYDCADTFLNSIIPWLDSHNVGYLAWAWTVGSCTRFPSLITNYNGTPTPYGSGFKQHLGTL